MIFKYTSPGAERYSRRQRRKKKYSAVATLLLLSQVNPLAESVDTYDNNSKEIQTRIITGDMTDSMQLELQTLRTEHLQPRSQVDSATVKWDEESFKIQ